MEANLPTTPGPYWWRETDGDEWEIGEIYRGCDGGLYWETMHVAGKPLEIFDGQWSKAHNPDEGIDAWAVFVEGMIRCHSIASTKQAVKDQLPFFESMHNKKCTVEAVTIYRKQES